MKIEDVEVGMYLRDPKGNVWEVLDKPDKSNIPTIHVQCVAFKHPVGVMPQYSVDSEAKAYVKRNILLNREHLVVTTNTFITQLNKYLSTFNTLKVVTGLNKTKILQFVTQAQYDNVEVTLEDLEPIPEPQHLTRENIRVGMHVRTALDTEFIVIGYTDTLVQLLYNATFNCKGKQLKQATAKIYIDWADVSATPVDALTTDDFTVVE